MVGHQISFSDNLPKLKLSGRLSGHCALPCMATDVTSQVPSKYRPAIELQETYSLPTPLNIILCNLPSFHKHCSNKKPFRASLIRAA